MGELKHGRTCVFNINYHIVWSTKYRRKVLTPNIDNRLKEILINVGKSKGFEIAKIEVGTEDHVQLSHTAGSYTRVFVRLVSVACNVQARTLCY